MDICGVAQRSRKQQQGVSAERLPLVPADNKNGSTRHARTRLGQSTVAGPKRCPSPTATRLSPTSTTPTGKRATSTERKRPSRPSSPLSPSTPIEDTSANTLLASRNIVGSRLPESLWPSTMRSLSVSFQSDTISIPIPICKKEKPVSNVHCDRALRLSSNVAQRQAETSASSNPTPERKWRTLKGKNSADQSENSKPDNNPRLTDQHLWPSRTSGKVSTALNRGSSNTANNTGKPSPVFNSGTAIPSLRRLSPDGMVRPLQKPTCDSLTVISSNNTKEVLSNACSDNSNSLHTQKLRHPSSSDRTQLAHAAAKSLSLLTPGSRPASPGISPSRAKAVSSPSRGPSPAPSRGPSPARVRSCSPSRQPQNSTSVLSFMADIKRGKKAANHIEDVHQLRMLYNRHLQWRYANAQTETALQSQKEKTEKMLYCVWRRITDLRDSVMVKRNNLQQLRLKLDLYLVLNNQLVCLNEWTSIERDYHNSLTGTIQDLQSSTILIPLTGRAKGDIETVKVAVYSAVDMIQAMGSSLSAIHPRVEDMNCLVSELAEVAAQERATLVHCETILGSTAALQDKECSIRTHLLLRKQRTTSHQHIKIS